MKLREFFGFIIILIIIFGTIILSCMTILISNAVSGRRVVVFGQHQPLHHHLPALLLPHLRQDHVALLLALDKAVEGVVVQVAELNSSSDSCNFHHQGRIANSTLQDDFNQLHEEIVDIRNSFFSINISKSELIS